MNMDFYHYDFLFYNSKELFDKILENLKNRSRRYPFRFSKMIYNKKIDYEEVKDTMESLKEKFIFFNFERILRKLNEEIGTVFHDIFYIAPLRATAERYYRVQGLDIDEISPDGSNLPMYLKNLDSILLTAFSNWTERNFNFRPTLTDKEGHISLEIIQDKDKINLTDTGFGFSQLLPILVQIWRKIHTNFFMKNNSQIFVIEQPELHLHPAMQAKLIDIIIKSIKIAKNKGLDIKFIIETHSETMINRIGRHIVEELFEPQDINLLIFEKHDKETEIIEAKFNNRGRLEKWPFGFFEPGDIDDDY